MFQRKKTTKVAAAASKNLGEKLGETIKLSETHKRALQAFRVNRLDSTDNTMINLRVEKEKKEKAKHDKHAKS